MLFVVLSQKIYHESVMREIANTLNENFKDKPVEDVLSWFITNYKSKIAFSTSLGAEDQVITQMLAVIGLPVRIFTLDTGRLFQESYDLLDITRKKYGMDIAVYFPDAGRVEEMVNAKGINLFYDTVENRQQCCRIRKIEPLQRALGGMEVWITGMRREQSVTRAGNGLVEWDEANRVIKLNPMIEWTDGMMWEYIRLNKIPVNELHAAGYLSIGCLPCTRPVREGEDIRSGRWWWERPENKECGLHKKN
jgi:phosphoadenosine phosphosulfate reductase